MCADNLGDHAAPVNIPDEDDRHVGGLGKSHIGNIVGTEVDLRGAAGALDKDKVDIFADPVEALQNLG